MTYLVLIGMPGGVELIIIVFVVLLLFGGRKIPELMRGLGKGIKEFNTARSSLEDELQKGMDEEEKKQKRLEAERLEKVKAEKEKLEAERTSHSE
ncbi:twin-arginine translocase TatA/TatE family subunit [Membranicola marinus]|uniref:Sec-independent protein translocase protein TatA n=1 Tax=Membranihabitans marinus TaxID=1227546 RepID=A0A953HSX4_9BACT|nr:twin-arginine translocase TatA/TatE family subunit [Membranihabitans marinus]MBY5957636.1 twin-arginine translocase TatA/TatE family subunit [Membranihabitans marinus]